MTSSDDVVTTEQADVLSADELANAYQRWEAPRMVSVEDIEHGKHKPLTVEAIEKLHEETRQEAFKNGYEEGYKSGYDTGIAAGQKQIKQQVAQLQQLIEHLNSPLQALDDQVEQDLLQLVQTLAQQFIQYELQLQPERVLDAMRAALAALPINDRKLKVYLNPQDIELVKSGLSLDHDDGRWQWLEDPLLTRGGVRLETADTTVNASVEARLARLIEKMLGERREPAE
ncbi:MAG TPA: flagellar assembly protein FliH [Methylophaga sp.]|nr:flagellar assembly protein FliH [Methylophaga sp.]